MQLEMSGFREMVEALERKHGSLNNASRKEDIPATTLLHIKKKGDKADPRYSTVVKLQRATGLPLPPSTGQAA